MKKIKMLVLCLGVSSAFLVGAQTRPPGGDGGGTSVPEPVTALLFAAGAAVMLRNKK